MATRILPIRATRKKNSDFRQSPSPPKIVKNEPIDEKEIQRKQNESKRKINEFLNLQKYPYRRAIHYFCNLDEFPRCKYTVSYAQDTHNVFKHNYSKDSLQIKQQKIGDLINRRLIGLPIYDSKQHPVRKQNRCKNICYAYLSQTQDKKHNNQRIIYTIKLLIKKLNKVSAAQLQKYDFVKKDNDLHELLSESLSVAQKKYILQNKLNNLIARKEANSQNWHFDDKIFYYHSLNQSLHNKVFQLKYKLSEDYINTLLLKRGLPCGNQNLTLLDFVKRMTQYYNTNQSALSFGKIRKVVSKQKSQILIKGTNFKSTINYPIMILYFGYDEILHDLSQFLLGRKAFSLGEVHFYELKMVIKKIFRRDLQVRSQKITSFQQFYKVFRKKYEEICQIKVQIQAHSYQSPLLDHKFSMEVGRDKKANLLKLWQCGVDITKRQFMFLMIYYWLTRSMDNIFPYLIRINDLIEIIGSDFFSKICNQFVQAIGTPLAGLIFYIFQVFTELMSKSSKQEKSCLRIEYDKELNVCVVWNKQIEAREEENNLRQSINVSRKKFRQN